MLKLQSTGHLVMGYQHYQYYQYSSVLVPTTALLPPYSFTGTPASYDYKVQVPGTSSGSKNNSFVRAYYTKMRSQNNLTILRVTS
jgi:hypothetical protein